MKVELPDAEATAGLGAALAQALAPLPGAVLYLRGDLGAGKTTLARGLLRALGIKGSIRSPTYTLMEPYSIPGREILHLDLYRLDDPRELHNLGLDDYPPATTLWLVEWPEKGANLLPAADVSVQLVLSDSGREAEIVWPSRLGPSPAGPASIKNRP